MLDKYISLIEAAAICPNRPGFPCIWRWCRKGIKTRDGGRAYLQHIRAGAKIFTTEEWLNDFFAAIAKADHVHFANDFQRPAVIKSTPSQREKSISKAERELEKAGI